VQHPLIEENVMKTMTSMIICASIALPFAAFAQMSDTDYCNALSKLYRETNTATQADVTVPEAMSKCATSPAGAIPVLEKWLNDNKVTLPKRT
jgi:hypothetical protein